MCIYYQKHWKVGHPRLRPEQDFEKPELSQTAKTTQRSNTAKQLCKAELTTS